MKDMIYQNNYDLPKQQSFTGYLGSVLDYFIFYFKRERETKREVKVKHNLHVCIKVYY